MDKLMGFSQKYPWAAILLLLTGILLSSMYLKNFSIDTSPDSFMKKDDPARFIYDETMETFGSDTLLMIYLEDENLFSVEKLGYLHELVSVFSNKKKFPGILRVESLYSINNIKGYPEYLDNGPLMDNPPETEKAAKEIRDNALENPLIVRNLISEEGNSTVINLYLEPITTGYDKEINTRTVTMVEEILFHEETGFDRHFKVLFDIGSPYIVEQLSTTILKDLGSILPLSMIVLLLMLIITTGSVNGAILPFITSMLSILYTAGFMGALNLPLNMLTFTVPILVIVIGSTEDVHLLSEYMEGLKKTGKRDLAVRYMCKAVGTAVFLTALTTFLGFISISINRIVVLKQFGLIAGFTMFINPLVTFLLAPMYLKFFGSKKVKDNIRKIDPLSRFISYISNKIIILITSKSKPLILSVTIFCLLIGSFAVFITVDNDSTRYFRKDSAIPKRISVLNEKLSGSQIFYITLRRKTVSELISEAAPANQDTVEVLKKDDIPVFDDTMELFQDTDMDLFENTSLDETPETAPIEESQEISGNAEIDYLFQKPEYLRIISDIQNLLNKKFPFGNSTSIADYIALMHKEMNAGQPGDYQETPDPSNPDSENLIAQYAMNLHHDEISRFITSDWTEANIIVRHNVTSTRSMQQELIKMNSEISSLLSGFDPMLDFKITGEAILTNGAADTIIISQTIGLSLLLVTILLIMSILFMNFKAGLVSLLPNIFPLLILYGIMGIFKIPLNVGTSMVGAIAIGLTVDDTIHFMTRFNLEMRKYQNREKAVNAVVSTEIRPVISTSIALILGFSILAFAQIMPIVYFGILAAVVMFCALLTDLFITPILLSNLQLTNIAEMAALRLAGKVKESPLFSDMTMMEIKKITLLGRTVTCNKGDYIIRSGDPGTHMYVILSGSAHVERVSSDGSETVFIDEVSTGSLLGEISLLRNVARTANVTAREEVTYMEIDWKGLMRLQKSAKSISIKLYKNIAAILGHRLVEMTDKLQAARDEET